MAKRKPVNPAPKIKFTRVWYVGENGHHSSHPHPLCPTRVEQEYEVEVLSIHFEKNTMRIRYPEDGWGIADVPATAFFEQIQMLAK